MESKQKELGWKKALLIILAIFILGPLVFVGTCFPLGALSFTYESDPTPFQQLLSFLALYGGLALAILVVVLVIRKIVNHK